MTMRLTVVRWNYAGAGGLYHAFDHRNGRYFLTVMDGGLRGLPHARRA